MIQVGWASKAISGTQVVPPFLRGPWGLDKAAREASRSAFDLYACQLRVLYHLTSKKSLFALSIR